MTQTTGQPALYAPVRIGDSDVHLGYLSGITGPNGEPRYCSYCPASLALPDETAASEAVPEEITCTPCMRQGGPEANGQAAEAAEAMTRAVLPNREYDHRDRCIGCETGRRFTCAPSCGFETRTVTVGMLLRGAAPRLSPRPSDTRIRAALDAAAIALMRTEATRHGGEDLYVEDLVDLAVDALNAYFAETGAPGGDLDYAIEACARATERRLIAETLYLAAARSDGAGVQVL